MRRFIWFLIVAFSASVLVLGCGKSEEPKPKQSAEQAAPAPKEGEKKKEAEKKESAEAAKPSESKPKDTQPGEAQPAARNPATRKNKFFCGRGLSPRAEKFLALSPDPGIKLFPYKPAIHSRLFEHFILDFPLHFPLIKKKFTIMTRVTPRGGCQFTAALKAITRPVNLGWGKHD